FAPTGGLPDWGALAGAGPVAAATLEQIFGQVDGSASVRQVIDRSRLGTFDAVRALAELRRAGLVAVSKRVAPRGARASLRGGVPWRASLRGLAATALPLLLLCAAALAALERRAPAATLPGFPIPRDAWAMARAEHATRGLAHAVDAQHFGSGEWPRSLDVVPGSGAAIAAARGAPYRYPRRDDGAGLLAPQQPPARACAWPR